MGKMQRDKGARIEREVVNRHRDRGLKAERVPLSGAAHYKGGDHDIDAYAAWEPDIPLCGEVKARKNGEGFKTILDWLGENDFLVLRADGAAPIYVIPERVWFKFLRGGE